MMGNPWYLMYAVQPSIEGQAVEGLVDWVSDYYSSNDVEPVCGEMDMLYFLM